jgi:Phage integrase, N-terminal SAM-like domain
VDTAPSSPPTLLDVLRQRARLWHCSLRTEEAYVHWARRFVRWAGRRHPRLLGRAEVEGLIAQLLYGTGLRLRVKGLEPAVSPPARPAGPPPAAAGSARPASWPGDFEPPAAFEPLPCFQAMPSSPAAATSAS